MLQVALESLLVCGGGSGVQGLALRLLRELRLSLPPSASPGLIQAPEYTPASTLQHSVWMGGAVLSKVDSPPGARLNDYELSICCPFQSTQVAF